MSIFRNNKILVGLTDSLVLSISAVDNNNFGKEKNHSLLMTSIIILDRITNQINS